MFWGEAEDAIEKAANLVGAYEYGMAFSRAIGDIWEHQESGSTDMTGAYGRSIDRAVEAYNEIVTRMP